jgi:hypothetical protein
MLYIYTLPLCNIDREGGAAADSIIYPHTAQACNLRPYIEVFRVMNICYVTSQPNMKLFRYWVLHTILQMRGIYYYIEIAASDVRKIYYCYKGFVKRKKNSERTRNENGGKEKKRKKYIYIKDRCSSYKYVTNVQGKAISS